MSPQRKQCPGECFGRTAGGRTHPQAHPTICVFCASSAAVDPAIVAICEETVAGLARRGWSLLYGGTTCGLMKSVAEAHKRAGGRLIGVITAPMVEGGICHPGLDEQIVAPDLRERKRGMTERSDAFLVLPGGIGTLDEFFDVLGQRQLEEHRKPIVLLNTNGYYDPLLTFLRHAVARKTIREEHLGLFQVVAQPAEVWAALAPAA